MLAIYLVLLYAVPSNLQITAVGSVGRPAVIWGVVLLAWWALSQVQPGPHRERMPAGATRVLLLALCVVALVSFASALLRGQPYDQVGSAASSLVRIASWSGVLLVAADGVRSRNEMVALFRYISIAAGALALLGFLQVATGARLLDWTAYIPGWEIDWSVMDSRGGTVRAVGTSTHPLEFSSTLTALLPIALAHAVVVFNDKRPRAWQWCIPPALAFGMLSITVTRSATIGVVIVTAAILPFLPRSARLKVLTLIGLGALIVAIAFPRIVQTILGAFTDVADDPSALSRANALARVPEFTANSPIIGGGWGTFLPRYYIFDNAWVLMLVEVGLLGVAAFALMLFSGVLNAVTAAVSASSPDGRVIGGALAAPLIAIAVQMALFDGLGFGQFAGTLFLLLGLSVAARTITEWGSDNSAYATHIGVAASAPVSAPRSTKSTTREVGLDLSGDHRDAAQAQSSTRTDERLDVSDAAGDATVRRYTSG